MIQKALGSGSNATTYRATTGDGREVAIKALSLHGIKDWKQLELFQREAQVLRALEHPGIPKYIDYFEEDTANDRKFFIVQEVVQGKSLGEMIREGMRATEPEVLRISTELLKIMDYLSSLRPPVIHRDIKPDNIILNGGNWGGAVYLVDFGGVQGVAADAEVMGSTIVGTYGYMAPEQFRGQATPSSDLYSLGATLLYLVSGRPPSSFRQERLRIDYSSSVSLGRPLSTLLDGLLEPHAEDRLSPADALATAEGRRPPVRRGAARLAQRQDQDQDARLAPSGAAPDGPWVTTTTEGTFQVPSPLPSVRWARKPAGSRVVINRTAGRLEVDIPPAGLTANTIGTGAFAVAWNAFVAFWTFSALASGGVLFALFSAPFWWAGAQLAGQAFGGGLLKEYLEVGRRDWALQQELAVLKDNVPQFLGGGRGRRQAGDSDDLAGARVVTTIIVNGDPQTAVELVEGVNTYRFGEGLQLAEQEWIVAQINDHIASIRGAEPMMSDMPPLPTPRVVNHHDSDTP